ncbi:MAG TPA: dTDP-4-dehydrorhamnose reductase [Candidatus Goldiibacteriota bacterium]|nr:dTDP-4-dehydrorhamnose reductase [Candidatus Goldiibacteriota bacterium]
MRILVFGGTGLLGTDIVKILKEGNDVIALGSADVDVSKLDTVMHSIDMHKPDLVINCAAISDVDKCEENAELSYKVNAIGPKNVAICCNKIKSRLLHISTDYVFDGNKNSPYTEFDEPNPISIYGRTKLVGEEFIKMISSNFLIIRTAWLFGERRNHFVDYVIKSLYNGDEIIAVKDMTSSPTFSYDVAEMIKELIETNEVGVFHICNKGYCSRVELVEEIEKITKKHTNVTVVNQSQWKRPAKRPVFSALRNYHLELIDKDNIPGWRDALKRYIKYKFKS